MGSAEGWDYAHSGFILLFLASCSFPSAPAQIYRLQSLQGCPQPGMARQRPASLRGCASSGMEHLLPRVSLYLCPQQHPLPHLMAACLSSSCPSWLLLYLKYMWADVPPTPLAGWGFGTHWGAYTSFKAGRKQLWLAQGSFRPPVVQLASCSQNSAIYAQYSYSWFFRLRGHCWENTLEKRDTFHLPLVQVQLVWYPSFQKIGKGSFSERLTEVSKKFQILNKVKAHRS